MSLALSGLNIVDFSMGVAGPYATALCAQHGANVTKIEPRHGDWARSLGRRHGDASTYFAIYNRGKKSIVIDLKTEEGRKIALSAAANADVVVESFRPGVMAKLGLDYASVRALNPKAIYVSISGFGQNGRRSRLPGVDSVAQGYSGFISLSKDANGRPVKVDMVIMDIVTGLYAYQSILTSVIHRYSGNTSGHYIDCSLLQSALALQACKLAEHELDGGGQSLYAPLGVYETADGYMTLSVNEDDAFERFSKAVNLPELQDEQLYATKDGRREYKDEINASCARMLKEKTTREWIDIFVAHEILHAPVWDYDDVLKDEDIMHSGYIARVQQGGMDHPIPYSLPPGVDPGHLQAMDAPHLGEHTKELLLGWGFSPEQIDKALSDGSAVQRPQAEPGAAS